MELSSRYDSVSSRRTSFVLFSSAGTSSVATRVSPGIWMRIPAPGLRRVRAAAACIAPRAGRCCAPNPNPDAWMRLPITAALAAAWLSPVAASAQKHPAYFQQGVSYRIEARLDEATSVLHGRARLHYTNHAPVALDSIYVHQHLNAFRPNSAWARRELQLGVDRFQALGPDDYAYERFTSVTIGGRSIRPVYPLSPDSTVAAIALPTPLAPGASVD